MTLCRLCQNKLENNEAFEETCNHILHQDVDVNMEKPKAIGASSANVKQTLDFLLLYELSCHTVTANCVSWSQDIWTHIYQNKTGNWWGG